MSEQKYSPNNILYPRPIAARDNFAPRNVLTCGTIVVGLNSRFKYFKQPLHPKRNKSLLYLVILLLSVSSDVESNPGPDYPCGNCGAEVTDSDPAVECDSCGMWFHIQCHGLDPSWYQQIVENDSSFAWTCSVCDNLNHSHVSSILSVSSHNSFSYLPDENQSTNQHTKHPTTNQHKDTFISKLKILLVNCQSVINKKHELQALIHDKKPDIVAATESWLKQDHLTSEIFPPDLGYTVFRRDRETGKGGGVFLLVTNKLIASAQPKFNTNCEILWIKLELIGSKPIYIASFYKPHESDINSLLELEKSLDLIRKTKGTKLILGDFNLPKLSWDQDHTPILKPGSSTSAVYDKFLSLMDDHNLTQMVNESTRNENTLDLLLTSNPTLITKVQTLPGISDHDTVLATLNTRPNILKQKPRNLKIYKKANWSDFRNFFLSSRNSILENSDTTSVEDLWAKFKNTIEVGIAKFVPVKKISCKKSLPWITKSIKKLIRKRDKLYTRLKKCRSDSLLRSHFKNIKNQIKHDIKHSYASYLEHILDIADSESDQPGYQSKFSTKKLYSLIKNSKQESQTASPLKDQVTGNLKSNDKDKANILNRQFQSVFSKTSPLSLAQCCLQQLYLLDPSRYCKYPQMKDISISKSGVLKLLSNLKVDKAAGPDHIRPVVLKELRHEIVDVITILFQKSLATGEIPSDWSRAFVCPIYKKGDVSDPANYRPISLTCILCKTLEHIVASALSSHFNSNNILYDLQHGFRERRSCETQLLELTDFLVNNISKGKQTDLILLDFSKAFDKVNHLKLLHTLQEHGVSPQILNWTRSFLIGRSQTVLLNGDHSTEVPVTSGVPQGSVLGPLFFLLYINKLPSSVTSQIRLFADDTAVYLTINSISDAETLQEDLTRMEAWESEWNMEFNPSKCQVLHITRNKNPIKHKYFLHGETLQAVSNAKYLGVDLSSDLSYSTHINRITTNANKTLGFLKRNILTKNEKVRELAYKTLVRPQVEYASSIWSPHTKTQINKVEMVQRRAVRWVKHEYSPLASVTAMQDSLGWRTLEQRRCDFRLIMFFRIYHHLVEVEFPSYIKKPVRLSRHMHPLSFRQIQVTSDYHKWSFYPHCITLWNSLPCQVATLPAAELEQFRRAVASIHH